MESKELACAIAGVIDEKQGRDIVVIDLQGKCDIADYFVIATASNARLVDAIVDEVEEVLKPQGANPFAIEGRPECTWALMDYGQVLVHVFQPETRDYYRLERMWADASYAEMNEDGVLEWHGRGAGRADRQIDAGDDEMPSVEGLLEDE